MSTQRKKILIAGASGFIGRWLLDAIDSTHEIIALSRNKVQSTKEHITWKQVDLFSRRQTTTALEGVDIAIYLVHSMSPKSKLFQGKFYDLDVLIADNFAYAANKNGIKKIIYLSGIIPEDRQLSYHLRSRLEVEQTLAQYNNPITTIRTGIIVGPGGSSYNILLNLVKTLPVMICPRWTLNKSQPVSLEFVLSHIIDLIENKSHDRRVINLFSQTPLTYKKMILETAESLGKKIFIIDIPLFSPKLSKLWVVLFGRSKFSLVSPLVDSLKHNLVIDSNNSMPQDCESKSFYEMAVSTNTMQAKPRLETSDDYSTIHDPLYVSSVQRLECPRGKNSKWVSKRYALWLQKSLGFILNVDYKENTIYFYFLNFKKHPLLVLTHAKEKSTENRRIYFITEGLLVKKNRRGWLEFRKIFDGRFIITAIHDYHPSLPWYLYRFTQAVFHVFIMNRFGYYLRTYRNKPK